MIGGSTRTRSFSIERRNHGEGAIRRGRPRNHSAGAPLPHRGAIATVIDLSLALSATSMCIYARVGLVFEDPFELLGITNNREFRPEMARTAWQQ